MHIYCAINGIRSLGDFWAKTLSQLEDVFDGSPGSVSSLLQWIAPRWMWDLDVKIFLCRLWIFLYRLWIFLYRLWICRKYALPDLRHHINSPWHQWCEHLLKKNNPHCTGIWNEMRTTSNVNVQRSLEEDMEEGVRLGRRTNCSDWFR